MEREVRECKTSDKDGGYFNMKGDGAMLAYTKSGRKEQRMSTYEAIQLMIDFAIFVIALLTLVVATVTFMMKK